MSTKLPACSLLLAVAVACGSDSATGAKDPVDPTGLWRFDIVNTIATGVCSDETGDVSVEMITITRTGSAPPYQVVASGFLDLQSNQLTGTIDSKNKLVISGSYSEDGGTTTTTHSLTATSATSMSGTESWSWTGGGGSCPNSKSTVTATRQ
jgi:hypothetical protein